MLERAGVNDPDARLLCGLDRIRPMGKFYEPEVDGEWAVIVPNLDGDELVDLLAFDPRTPETWWVRFGGEPLLGSVALSEQLLDKPLHVFRTPLSRLQAGCDGVVLLDLNRAFTDLVCAPHGIVGEDDAHTDELRRLMTDTVVRRLPRFLVRQREAA